MHELLTPEQMAQADAFAIKSGTPGYALMKRAGAEVARAAMARWPNARRIVLVAGGGNNGGDAYVAANAFLAAGLDVTVLAAADPEKLTEDAALAFRDCRAPVKAFDASVLTDADMIVDGLFGAGLSRAVEGRMADVIKAMNESAAPVLAIDLPSGIDGASGQVRGAAVQAEATVTFFRKKPGHLLMPGRTHCGDVECADIGIAEDALDGLSVTLFENSPSLWMERFPRHEPGGHKYTRGHALVLSGPRHATGASRLAAQACLRAGAGLVSLGGDDATLTEHAAHLTAIMLRPVHSAPDVSQILDDGRFKTVIYGPGAGLSEATADKTLEALGSGAACVLDADALTVFQEKPGRLFDAIAGRSAPVVLTPHEGECKRLFPDLAGQPNKLERAGAASSRSAAVIVLKGADTVIAAPDGRAAINANAPPWLGTAGSGDVLAGVIGGLLSQGMTGYDAACAGVWLHGEAGREAGPAMTADDLDGALKTVLGAFRAQLSSRSISTS